jgi:thiamine kinase-like enzyme
VRASEKKEMKQAETLVRNLPFWNALASIEPLKGGVSNASFRVTDATGIYVARVGNDYPCHQVNRAREVIASRAAHASGLSPELVFAADGVSVIRFIDAKTFSEHDVELRWNDCLETVRRCHRDMARHITGQAAIFWVFQILRDYGAQLFTANHRLAGKVPEWMKITDTLENVQVPLPFIFGHHDLLPTNFMDDGKRLWLIDWEYGAFGTCMFDLANLCVNNALPPAMEQEVLRAYFGKAPDAATQRAFSAMKVASGLREAMWGMVSELYLNAPGINYAAYAEEYLVRFERAHAAYKENFA